MPTRAKNNKTGFLVWLRAQFRKRPLSVGWVIAGDILLLGLALVVFSLFHHVLPSKLESIGIVSERESVQVVQPSVSPTQIASPQETPQAGGESANFAAGFLNAAGGSHTHARAYRSGCPGRGFQPALCGVSYRHGSFHGAGGRKPNALSKPESLFDLYQVCAKQSGILCRGFLYPGYQPVQNRSGRGYLWKGLSRENRGDCRAQRCVDRHQRRLLRNA